MGSCAAPSAKGDDKFITTDYLQQCQNFSPRETTLQITFRLFTTELEMFMHGSIKVCMTVMDLGQILKSIS
ncbi:hypothetical protein, partial [Klebsiella pneumoniae]|uniref:hypothetical protein n=1 Tax=Klebsiella pneumoniae TaxID=573 RepID=UPI00351E214E